MPHCDFGLMLMIWIETCSEHKFDENGDDNIDNFVFEGIPHRRGGLRHLLEASARI